MVQPLTATFAADFSNFKDAVSRAEASLQSFGQNANNVEKDLTRMGNSLSGAKIVQQATVAAEAIELIGGVSTLTDKQLQQLGKTASEAAQKLERMGLEVPANIRNIATAAKEAEQNTNLLGKISDFIGPKLVAAFSVGAITAWVSKIVDAGSHIEDLSRKLDVSHEAIQRWGYAAELSGGSIDDVSQAITFMNKTLAGGSNSTIDALTRAGLAFDQIRSLSPEDAFDVITEAIKNIPDPMDQARVATELFGKGAASILPAIRDGFREVGKEASIMSDDTIAALDEAGDTWTRFKNKFTVASAAIIALATDTDHIFASLALTVAKLHDNVSAGLITSVPKLSGVFGALPATAKPAQQALDEFNKEFDSVEQKRKEDATKAIEDHTAKIRALADTLSGQAIAQKARDLGEALKMAGGAAHLSADQTEEYFKAADALVKGPLGANALPKNVRALWEENGKLALGMTQTVIPSLDKFYNTLYGIDQKLPELKLKTVAFLNSTSTNVIAAWKADEKAGTEAAKEIERQHKESLKAIEERHNQFVATIQGYTTTLVDGLVHGWDGFKQAGMSVLNDILHYMESVFVRKMLEYFGLAQVGATNSFAAIGQASANTAAQMLAHQQQVSTGASVAAASTTASWLSTFAQMASGAATAYLALMFLRTALAPHHTPDTPTPTSPPPNTAPNPEPGTPDFQSSLDYAQQLFDQGQSAGGGQNVMQAFMDYMYSHPDLWGKGNGFATGTHGQYLDFGSGTPVMLHGRERVMTEAEGRGGWAPTINIYNPVMRDARDIDMLSDRIALRLQARGV